MARVRFPAEEHVTFCLLPTFLPPVPHFFFWMMTKQLGDKGVVIMVEEKSDAVLFRSENRKKGLQLKENYLSFLRGSHAS